MDNTIYDFDMIGIDMGNSIELHAITGALGLFIISCFASYFAKEVPQAYEELLS